MRQKVNFYVYSSTCSAEVFVYLFRTNRRLEILFQLLSTLRKGNA